MRGVKGLQNRAKGRKSARRRRSGRRAYVWFALAATVLVAVLVCPSPYSGKQGGIVLHGDDPTAEIYGPELPKTIVGGYTEPVIQSVVLDDTDDSATDDPNSYYYAQEDEKTYHTYTCKKAYASSQRLTLYEAYFLGYQPCESCNPPVYTAES